MLLLFFFCFFFNYWYLCDIGQGKYCECPRQSTSIEPIKLLSSFLSLLPCKLDRCAWSPFPTVSRVQEDRGGFLGDEVENCLLWQCWTEGFRKCAGSFNPHIQPGLRETLFNLLKLLLNYFWLTFGVKSISGQQLRMCCQRKGTRLIPGLRYPWASFEDISNAQNTCPEQLTHSESIIESACFHCPFM